MIFASIAWRAFFWFLPEGGSFSVIFLLKLDFLLGMPAGGLPFWHLPKRKQKRDLGALPLETPLIKGLVFTLEVGRVGFGLGLNLLVQRWVIV